MNAEALKELKAFVHHVESLRKDREKEWRELAEWVIPHRGIFEGEGEADKPRNAKAINRAAVRSLKRGAAGMTSGMTPASLPWFRYGFRKVEHAEIEGARAFADYVDNLTRLTLQEGGFYQAIHEFNMDLLGFGCALLYAEHNLFADDAPIMRFECIPTGTYAVALNAEKNLDALVRRVQYSARQMADMFGAEALSAATQNKLEKAPFSQVEVVHVVRRREQVSRWQDSLHMPFASYMYEAKAQEGEGFLRESGYQEVPYFFTSWEGGRGLYGTGCGDDALPDARQIDAMERKKLIGLDKMIDPPMRKPIGFKGRLNTMPGGENAVSREQGEGLLPLYQVNFAPALAAVQTEIQNVMHRIDETLQASLFAAMPLEQRPPGMSATEYLERKREALQLMGPTLAAYEPQVLSKVLRRVARVLDRENLLPPLPAGLALVRQIEGLSLDTQFISPIAQAMRQTGAETTRALVADAIALAQVAPSVLDKLDLDQAVDEMATGLGAPGRVVRSDALVARIREERALAQQLQKIPAILENMPPLEIPTQIEALGQIAEKALQENAENTAEEQAVVPEVQKMLLAEQEVTHG